MCHLATHLVVNVVCFIFKRRVVFEEFFAANSQAVNQPPKGNCHEQLSQENEQQ